MEFQAKIRSFWPTHETGEVFHGLMFVGIFKQANRDVGCVDVLYRVGVFAVLFHNQKQNSGGKASPTIKADHECFVRAYFFQFKCFVQ